MLTRAVLLSFPRTMRAVPARSLAGVALFAAAPTVITVLRDGDDLSFAFVAAAIVGGAGLGYAVDDDAALLLAASPTPLAHRRAARLAAATCVAAVGWITCVAAARAAGFTRGLPIRSLIVEAVTAAGIAVATAALARCVSYEKVGLAGVTLGVLLPLVVTALAVKYAWLPRLADPTHHERWLWLAGAAWFTAAWASRDPAMAGWWRAPREPRRRA